MRIEPTPSRRIIDAVTAWPGVTIEAGDRGELAFKVGKKELGHLHGDSAAHFGFSKPLWSELMAAGRITHHPVFPGRAGPAARRIRDTSDVEDVIRLLRLNYERIVAVRRGGGSLTSGERAKRRPAGRRAVTEVTVLSVL